MTAPKKPVAPPPGKRIIKADNDKTVITGIVSTPHPALTPAQKKELALQKAATEVNEGLVKMANILAGDLTKDEAMGIYQLIKGWEKNIGEIKKGANQAMKDVVKMEGTLAKGSEDRPELVSMNGHYGGRHFSAAVETSYKTEPDATKIREKLAEKGIVDPKKQNAAAFDAEITYKPSFAKAVKGGHLTEAQWNECRPVHQERLKIKEG